MSELSYGVAASAIVAVIAFMFRVFTRSRDINYVLRNARPLARDALTLAYDVKGKIETVIAYYGGADLGAVSLQSLKNSAWACVSKIRAVEDELEKGIVDIRWDDPRDKDRYRRHQQNIARAREFLGNAQNWFERWSWSELEHVMVTRADLSEPKFKDRVERDIKSARAYLEISKNELEPSLRWFSRDKIFFSDEPEARRPNDYGPIDAGMAHPRGAHLMIDSGVNCSVGP